MGKCFVFSQVVDGDDFDECVIAPGVPWCVARDREGPFAITLKSGNFGSEDFFARALQLSGGL